MSEGVSVIGPSLRFPIQCPRCARELLLELNVARVAAALLEEHPLQLYAACHNLFWVADEQERQQIREYLEANAIRAVDRRVPM
jgi:hypothetical protein